MEEIFCQHPKIIEAGIIGIPDKVYGEEIKTFVVLESRGQASEEKIIAFCKEHLPTFKIPKKVKFTESLPKNLFGKVLRAELQNPG